MVFVVTCTFEINPLHDDEAAKTELARHFREDPVAAILAADLGERQPVAVSVERRSGEQR